MGKFKPAPLPPTVSEINKILRERLDMQMAMTDLTLENARLRGYLRASARPSLWRRMVRRLRRRA